VTRYCPFCGEALVFVADYHAPPTVLQKSYERYECPRCGRDYQFEYDSSTGLVTIMTNG